MAKRARGARSGHRPGGQGPSRTRKSGDTTSTAVPAAAGPGFTGGADIDAAIETVALESEELAAAHEAYLEPPTTRKARRGAKVRSDSLEARIAAENVFIAEDLRRIGILTIGLVAALLVVWVLLVPLELGGLY